MTPDVSPEAALRQRSHDLPAWLMSLAAHLVAAILVASLLGIEPPRAIDEADRPASIVLTRRSQAQTEYFSDTAGTGAERHEVRKPAVDVAESERSALPIDEAAPAIAGIALPGAADTAPAGDGLVAAPSLSSGRGRGALFPGLDAEAILAEDATIPRETPPTGPKARLSLFGAAAEGRSFVFVIDRSRSMGADGLGVIQAAAGELQSQLGELTDDQSLQVVAYNQSPAFLGDRKLIPASEANKVRLVQFVANLAAFGQTEHSPALIAALRLKPEVIFLLTDGGDPVLHEGELRAIRELGARRTTIHCLHFGRGTATSQSFLARLADQNRGQYVYIDVSAR
jgi:hypothetical protein